MTTLISHIYNEEFLLPFFIDRHYGKFDRGIILDFGSTDQSLNILKEKAPEWTVVDCSDEVFDALKLDDLVHSIEEKTRGVCLALTVTEFFVGDPRFISQEMVLPCYSLLRTDTDPQIEQGRSFHETYKFGISPFRAYSNPKTEWLLRLKGRKIRSTKDRYPIGRHYQVLGKSPFLIYRVANCLASNEMIERRLQIQERIPLSDRELGFGVQHTNYGKGLDIHALNEVIINELSEAEDISKIIDDALDLERNLGLIPTDSAIFRTIKTLIEVMELNQQVIDDLLHKSHSLENDLEVAKKENWKLPHYEDELIAELNALERKSEMLFKLEDELKNSQKLMNEIIVAGKQEREALMDRIFFFENQSMRPSHNLKRFLSTILPALKIHLRRLLR